MAKDEDPQQEALRGMYDLQQQFLNNFRQMLSPDKPQNPFDQLWSPWAGMTSPANPFGTQQNPFSQWMPPDFASASTFGPNDIYQQMIRAFALPAANPANVWSGLQPDSSMFDASRVDLGFEQLTKLLSSGQAQHSEQLLKSLQAYQRVSIEIAQLMARLAQESIERLQKQLAEDSSTDLDKLPQRWTEISQQVLQQAADSEDYHALKKKLEETQEQLLLDTEQYRKALAEALGLVTQESFNALKRRLDELANKVDELSTEGVNSAANSGEDFTVLNGVGRKFNEKLHEQGIRNLEQLASMSDDMLHNLDSDLQAKGRVIQDQWREQAEQFLNTMTGKTSKK
jgi:predicted flap endonuclease-1-like 5' DNA nuclease